jgi:cation transport ATPase
MPSSCRIRQDRREKRKTRESGKRRKIMKKTYKIDVDCANCANKMEDAARKTAGVKEATVNFMTLKMIVEFEEGQDPKEVMQQVRKNCKKVEDECEVFL